jgi:hypothetical protein
MFNNYNNRVVYMEARFFNAKTGRVHTFNNIPQTYQNPIDINTYRQQSNHAWRTVPITIYNPNTFIANGERIFEVYPLQDRIVTGADGNPEIIMSEFILK